MAKLGRPKKEILESDDLQSWHKFLHTISKNAKLLGDSLTQAERAFLDEYLVKDGDDDWTVAVKALKFKKNILHKCLTQDECTHFVDFDSKGTKPTKDKHLTKMTVCKIEKKACMKLRKALGTRFNIFELSDVYDTARHRTAVEEMTFDTGPNTGLSVGEEMFLRNK